jgi:hypothetical protein
MTVGELSSFYPTLKLNQPTALNANAMRILMLKLISLSRLSKKLQSDIDLEQNSILNDAAETRS